MINCAKIGISYWVDGSTIRGQNLGYETLVQSPTFLKFLDITFFLFVPNFNREIIHVNEAITAVFCSDSTLIILIADIAFFEIRNIA